MLSIVERCSRGMGRVALRRPPLYIGKIANFDTTLAMRIHILALNGVFDTGLAAVLDAFSTANALAKMSGTSSLPFQTKVVGLRNTVTTAQGLSVPVTSATRAQTPDAVVMPAINRIVPELLVHALASGEVREAGAVLRKWSGRCALTAAACVGSFLLAEGPLLAGEAAPTTSR